MSMFWSKKDKKTPSRKPENKTALAGNANEKKSFKDLKGDDLRAQALATARAARAELGEETIQRIAAAITKKQNSPIEKAKEKIQNTDAERVANEILAMLDE